MLRSDTSESGFISGSTPQCPHVLMVLYTSCGMTMLFFLWLLFALGNVSSNVPSSNEKYPPKWDSVPESLYDFSIVEETVIINPWDYEQRMGIYKVLLNVTAPFLDMKEPGNKRNMLWGLTLQHGWQFFTERLKDTSIQPFSGQDSESQTSISAKSWWACMNYHFSVIPFLGAIDAGLFEGFPYGISISPPDEFQSDFCLRIEECRSTSSIDEWKAFFESIKTFDMSDSSSNQEDRFLSNMWKAHTESINAGLPYCSKRLQYLSGPEAHFAEVWATTVEFIAATNFPADFQSTNDFQTCLPPRILVETDKPPFIPDFTEQQNRVMASLQAINKANTFTGGFLLKLWKKAMCSEQGRAAGRDLLQKVANDPLLAPESIVTIMIELVKNAAC